MESNLQVNDSREIFYFYELKLFTDITASFNAIFMPKKNLQIYSQIHKKQRFLMQCNKIVIYCFQFSKMKCNERNKKIAVNK